MWILLPPPLLVRRSGSSLFLGFLFLHTCKQNARTHANVAWQNGLKGTDSLSKRLWLCGPQTPHAVHHISRTTLHHTHIYTLLFLSLPQHPPHFTSPSLFLFQDLMFAMRQSRHYFHCLPLLWQHPLRFEGHWDFKGDRQFYTTGEVHLFLVSQCNLQRGKKKGGEDQLKASLGLLCFFLTQYLKQRAVKPRSHCRSMTPINWDNPIILYVNG